MNEIIKIEDLTSLNLSESYLPVQCTDGNVAFVPEFWIEIPATKQQSLIALFKQYRVEYLIFEINGMEPRVSMTVCRFGETFHESWPVIRKICNQIGIDKIIISDGGISTIDSEGELINFISLD